MNLIVFLAISGITFVGSLSGWDKCGTNGNICHVTDGLFNNVTYSQGYSMDSIITRYGTGKQWSYRKFRDINAFRCEAKNFGNPCSGAPSGACDGSLACFYKPITDADYFGPRGLIYAVNLDYYDYGSTIKEKDYFKIYKLYINPSLNTFTYFVGPVNCENSLFYDEIIYYEG